MHELKNKIFELYSIQWNIQIIFLTLTTMYVDIVNNLGHQGVVEVMLAFSY